MCNVQTHQIVKINYVQFFVYQTYLKKTCFKKMNEQKTYFRQHFQEALQSQEEKRKWDKVNRNFF